MPQKRTTWQTIRIPRRTIEHHYGDDNLDDAGDDLIHALRIVSEHPNQYRYCFSFDATHTNPWHHALVFEIEDITDSVYERFIEMVGALGLIELPGTN